MASAGLIPYRLRDGSLEILIAHPGGPFWAKRQEGAWTIVKGEIDDGEEPYMTAIREFAEETGWAIDPSGPIPLGEITQKSGKRVLAWAFEKPELDPATLRGDTITTIWRGREIRFAEIDEVRWCDRNEAERLLNPAQAVYYERLNQALAAGG